MFWTESAKISYSPYAVAFGQKYIYGHVWHTSPVWAVTGAELYFSGQKEVCDVKTDSHAPESVFVF